jgi:FKBP12-rapamycin complex-associated protein
MTSLDLQMVSSPLVSEQNLRLAVPGTYRVHTPIVRIAWFSPTVAIFPSKQRPRRIAIAGTDGRWYRFLLKGHEDLRQDERVMQLFGLVNTLLANDADTRKQDLSIRRYSVTPLSHSAGVVGWLAGHDTWHGLIEEYRSSKKIAVNVEQRVMARQAPHYESLRLLAKAEVFTYALDNTTGLDLARVLWRKSTSSERWLQRRTQYTRSLAVMSIVGYILGLGDRHPSNLMLDRASGRIAHIDFGDCFEVAMTREKLPERVPFRLTRMLINSMEVSGIEGNFRCTAEGVMRVLRRNRDSVMAMLEAFVHDPLINWRLLHTSDASGASDVEGAPAGVDTLGGGGHGADATGAASLAGNVAARGGGRGGTDKPQGEGDGGGTEGLNERAVAVLNRIKNKLTGRDFVQDPVNSGIGGPVAGQCVFQALPAVGATCDSVGEEGPSTATRSSDRSSANTMSIGEDMGKDLEVPAQVQRLVLQATSHENLCQSYIGWCPFW